MVELDSLDWIAIQATLDAQGYACIPDLLSRKECQHIAGMYTAADTHFRSTINMARYNFGRGEYNISIIRYRISSLNYAHPFIRISLPSLMIGLAILAVMSTGRKR